jgi:hypothetical protein
VNKQFKNDVANRFEPDRYYEEAMMMAKAHLEETAATM